MTTGGTPELSLVVPWCLRTGPSVPGVAPVLDALSRLGMPFELIVVGAPGEVVPSWPGIPVPPGTPVIGVAYNPLRGAMFYLEEAVESCRGSWVLVIDPNLWYDEAQFSAMLAQRPQCDVILTSKFHPDGRHTMPPVRRIALGLYRRILALLLGCWVDDPQPAVKLYRTTVLRGALQRALFKPYVFDLELLLVALRHGARVKWAPLLMRQPPPAFPWQPLDVLHVVMDTLSVWYRARIQRYYDRPQPAADGTPLVSIVIPCVVPGPHLAEALQWCERLRYPQYEILVLPDAPVNVPGTHVTVIPTGAVPPGAKRDLGVRQARGTLVAFLDDDAAPSRWWLSRAVHYFRDPQVAGVGGPAVTPANDGLRQVCSGAVYSSVLVTGGKQYRYIPAPARDVEELPTSNLIVRRDDFLRVGGFGTRYWPGEDTLVCLKLTRQLRKRIVYDPDVLVFHHRRPLFRAHLQQVCRYAEHRGYFVRRFRTLGFHPSYCIPSVLVVAVASSGLVLHAWPWLAPLYAGGAAAYAATALSYGLRVGSLPMAGLIGFGTIATHFVYGLYFLRGLLAPQLPEARRAA